MRLLAGRVAFSVVLILAIPAALGALHLYAPAATEPASSAFRSGDEHLAAWAQDMQSGYDLRSAVSGQYLLDTADATRTLLVIHSPQQGPDQAFLDGYLARGGSLWVLDPEGAYNPWLAGHGVAVGPHRLVDPTTAQTGTVRLVAADHVVVARSPTALVLDEDLSWDLWLAAPPEAHLDLDDNGTIDRIDVPGPHPVGAAIDPAIGGRLFVTADASLLHDGLRDGSDNAAFTRWVATQLLPEGGAIVVDESQHGWSSQERLPVAAVQSVQGVQALPDWATILAAAIVCIVAAVLAIRAPVLRPYKEHVRTDPVTPPPGLEGATVHDAAWELLAARSKQPVDRLKRLGAEAANGLADDPVLRRVLLGRPQSGDEARILQEYLRSQNRSGVNT